jgi:hypothetical protein
VEYLIVMEQPLSDPEFKQRIYRICVRCEKQFYINERDQQFFYEQKIPLPKHCWDCRQQNKREAENALEREVSGDVDREWNERLKAAQPDSKKWEDVWNDKPKAAALIPKDRKRR